MAKVYSWVISNSPKKYAYIKSPNSESAYIGPELTGEDLEKVSDWVSTCTDEEYKVKFENMKNACENNGYNVNFEHYTSYINVSANCDNLKGEDGRGINSIKLESTSDNYYHYRILYNDNTYDTFVIDRPKDGKDGKDGIGTKGDKGVSSKFIMVYTSGVDSQGETIIPDRPEGGEYDFLTNTFKAPEGWTISDENINPPVWTSTRTFASIPEATDKVWSTPVRLTGDNGRPGEDGLYTEFIYQLNPNKPDRPITSENENGYVPGQYIEDGVIKYKQWKPSPQGVDEDNKKEWSCVRRSKKNDNGVRFWGDWEEPTIWSNYGSNGQDGDGVQYIYLRTEKGTPPKNPTPYYYKTFNVDNIIDNNVNKETIKEICERYQEKNEEWIPSSDVVYRNINDDDVIYTATTVYDEIGGTWTDNPIGTTINFQYEWVSSRKFRIQTFENEKGENETRKIWCEFSDPSLWSKFGENGKNGTAIRKLYFLSTGDTSYVPQVPTSSTITGEWVTGFPIDYDSTKHIVWGTEAEIWSHNNEFVGRYNLVKKTDNIIEDGENTNCVDVTNIFYEIPEEKYSTYDYIKFDEEYYKWDINDWCPPYLVTGLKGDTGSVDYITTIFVYGFSDCTPDKPKTEDPKGLIKTFHNCPEFENVSLEWEDFPNITKTILDNNQNNVKRIDGVIDHLNRRRRWYQCQGQVGTDNKIKKDKNNNLMWGPVMPTNGKDGDSDYTEYRFCVTEDLTKPEVEQYISGNTPNEEPEYFNDRGVKIGWFTTEQSMPEMPEGGAVWQIHARKNGKTGKLIDDTATGKYWFGPIRVSGEKGERGLPGPAGLRGTTGMPGVSIKSLYCLGTNSDNPNDYYFRDKEEDFNKILIESGMSIGYFGNKVIENETGDTIDNWYTNSDIPTSLMVDINITIDNGDVYDLKDEYIVSASTEDNDNKYYYLKVKEQDLYNDVIEKKLNDYVIKDGHIAKVKINVTNTNKTYYQYYLKVVDDCNYKRLTRILTKDESEKFNVIIWCVQGNDVVTSTSVGKYEQKTDVIFEGNTSTVSNLPLIQSVYNKTELFKLDINPCFSGKTYIYYNKQNKYYKWDKTKGGSIRKIDANGNYTDEYYSENELLKGGFYYNYILVNDKEIINDKNSIGLYDLLNNEVLKIDDLTTIEDSEPHIPINRVKIDSTLYDYIINDVEWKYNENKWNFSKKTVSSGDCYTWKQYDGDLVEYNKYANWGTPFRLQGVNGLRGLAGNRGQVIYPMGIYNMNEVYVTTTEKAPYVYDPSDGLFYVLNETGYWVGELPDKHETIMLPPIDYAGNYTNIDEAYSKFNKTYNNNRSLLNGRDISRLGDDYEKDLFPEIDKIYKDNKKYINITKYDDGSVEYNNIFFEIIKWSYDDNDNIQSYKLNVRGNYKYKNQDTGEVLDDEGGKTPSIDYSNAISNNIKPKWERFETFKALYTSIGIIENGSIGSAIFNNEFMFSQQGYDFNDNESTYNVKSSYTYGGFLSAYEYDNYGAKYNSNIYHWKYKSNRGVYFLKDEYLDPYIKISGLKNTITLTDGIDTKFGGKYIFNVITSTTLTNLSSTERNCYLVDRLEINSNCTGNTDCYLHEFRPNICMNFATGQMWLSCGKITFDKKDTNITTKDQVSDLKRLSNLFGTASDFTGAVLSNFLGIKSGQNNLVGFINGKGETGDTGNYLTFDDKPIALALGIEDTSGETINFFSYKSIENDTYYCNKNIFDYNDSDDKSKYDDFILLNVLDNKYNFLNFSYILGHEDNIIMFTDSYGKNYCIKYDGPINDSTYRWLNYNTENDDVYNDTYDYYYLAYSGATNIVNGSKISGYTQGKQTIITCNSVYKFIGIDINNSIKTLYLRKNGNNTTPFNKYKLAKTIITNDGTIITRSLNTRNQYFNGTIKANGEFEGDSKGTFNGDLIDCNGRVGGVLFNSNETITSDSKIETIFIEHKQYYEKNEKNFKNINVEGEFELFNYTIKNNDKRDDFSFTANTSNIVCYYEQYNSTTYTYKASCQLIIYVKPAKHDEEIAKSVVKSSEYINAKGNERVTYFFDFDDLSKVNITGNTDTTIRCVLKYISKLPEQAYYRRSECYFMVYNNAELRLNQPYYNDYNVGLTVKYNNEIDGFSINKNGLKFKNGKTFVLINENCINFQVGGTYLTLTSSGLTQTPPSTST